MNPKKWDKADDDDAANDEKLFKVKNIWDNIVMIKMSNLLIKIVYKLSWRDYLGDSYFVISLF